MSVRARNSITATSFLAVALGLAGCGDEAHENGSIELEPGQPAGVPGAAGSITPEQWDTDPDLFLTRDDFGRWDANEDGVIDPDEWRAMVDSLASNNQDDDDTGP